MGIIDFVIKFIIYITIFLITVSLLYVILITLKIIIKNTIKKKYKKTKITKKRIYIAFKNKRFINIIEFIKWCIIDIIRGKDKARLYGLWAFCGYFGEGKTLGAVTFALMMQKRYPHRNISIYTNFSMKKQNGKITQWQDLLDLPKNSIVIFDEIQSTFTSQKFKEFPIDLLWKITQCRKQGLMVLCSTPVFNRMAIQIRENIDYVITCKNILKLDRWFNYDFYRAPEYEKYQDSMMGLGLRMHKEMNISLVAQDKDYKQYDTTQIVDRMDIENNTHNENQQKRNIIKKELQENIKLVSK